jgi:hypothetical protein
VSAHRVSEVPLASEKLRGRQVVVQPLCAVAIEANRVTLRIDAQSWKGTTELSGSTLGDRSRVVIDHPYELPLTRPVDETLPPLVSAFALGFRIRRSLR